MHRIDADAHVSNQFSDGDAGIGQPGTKMDAAWANAVQEEIANAITDAGIALVKGTNTQLAAAIASRFAAPTWTAITLGANWSADVSSPPAYWKDGLGVVHLRGVAVASAGASATILTLPPGVRPGKTMKYMGQRDADVPVGIWVTTTGEVATPNFSAGAGAAIFLDGHTFVAE